MKKIHFAVLFCVALSSEAFAQMTWYPPVGTWSGPAQLNNELVMDSLNQNNGDQAEVIQNKNSISLDSNPTYTPSKPRTRTNLQALGKRLAASDPANGAQAEQLFASTDVVGAVQGVMDQFGLERNNVAHAYALYWVVYWGLANKVSDTPSPAALQAVAEQAERGFAANADFAAMDNAQKQAAAEELMALTAIMDATSEHAKSDPALAEKIAKASLEGSRKSGLDLDKMTLTEDGFVPAKARKRSDASDATEVEEKALASASNTDSAAADGPNYALIAGAGGLGLAFLAGKMMGKKG